MKIFKSLLNGITLSVRSWKGVLIIWFLSLLLVCMVAIPLKGSLMSGFGKSMIAERLSDGLNLEVLVDLGTGLNSLISSFSSGFFFLIVVGFLMNTFFTGGLFSSLRGSSVKFSSSEFFRAAAFNYWSFLVIILIVTVLVIILAFVVFVVPVTIVSQAESATEKAVYNTVVICGTLSMILILVLLLVTDFARAWQAANVRRACFRAIGFGFRQTFRTFLSSFPLMIILMIVPFLFGWLVLKILPGWRPATGSGIFLLFLVSQFLFFIKIMLRAWRYACVTSFMEQGLIHTDPNLIKS